MVEKNFLFIFYDKYMAGSEKKNIFATMKGAENNWFLTPQQSIAISSGNSSNPAPAPRA